ncbi:MAG: A/G-specific adenine glycosylase [Alcaligenaceae bacterium]|nr:A/G-specific adenine glycosylase [Alcaligenaceae bacterium]
MSNFVQRLCAWQRTHGRHDLPWQSKDPYKVWLSEIMLQQTQVVTVINYYERFLARFPTIFALAKADQTEVMSYWAGLGYYARARNLHRCAQIVVEQYQGVFPKHFEDIVALPGIGRSTAHAIMAFCYGAHTPIMDGNVKRLFCRYFGIEGVTNTAAVDRKLWEQAEQTLAEAIAEDEQAVDMACYTQALMDFGSLICTRSKPQCDNCPVKENCYAQQHGLQQDLPTRNTRKSIPTRHTVMLLLVRDGEILLEQRPQEGIWGGLLSLPEFSDQDDLLHDLQNRGLSISPKKVLIKMAAFEHVFSHFKLHIQAILFKLKTNQSLQDINPKQSYYPLKDWHKLPIPKPVSTLLDTLTSIQIGE